MQKPIFVIAENDCMESSGTQTLKDLEEEEKEEVAGDEDEELNVHHTASVGDVEV